MSLFELEDFVNQQLELVEIEQQAESDEYLGKMPSDVRDWTEIFLPNLRFKYAYDRTMRLHYVFGMKAERLMPPHRLACGDRVNVGRMCTKNVHDVVSSGIVTYVDDSTITVALDQFLTEEDKTMSLFMVKIPNIQCYPKMIGSLKRLIRENSPLVDVAFGYKMPTQSEAQIPDDFKFFNENLNADQKKAVHHALLQNEIAIIHGPPGTGKTTTLAEVILQLVSRNCKVLVCGPSNVSVDNIVEKLQKYKIKMVRLGHPSRFLPSVAEHAIDKFICSDGEVGDIRKEIGEINNQLPKLQFKSHIHEAMHKRGQLRSRLREKINVVEKSVLLKVDVVLSTILTDNAIDNHLPCNFFDVVIIDECSKALEAACWVPLQRAHKCVLAGDHFQLPPVIKAGDDIAKDLEVTIMDRLINMYDKEITYMLTTQYRMHEDIMKWISKELYDDRLIAHESVANHLLKDLPNVQANEFTSIPIIMIDTEGCSYEEFHQSKDDSRGNEDEADLIVYYLESLIQSGVRPHDIGVITPYSLQVEFIKRRIEDTYPEIEVKSVDGFQGREKEAIVLSLVRSNREGIVGFLADRRRTNVAITRAKRHLAIICDSGTVSNNPFLKEFINYINDVGEIHSAARYENAIGRFPRKKIVTTTVHSNVKERTKCKKPNSKINGQGSSHNSNNFKDNVMDYTDNSNSRDAEVGRYQGLIEDFCNGPENIFTFPVTLSGYDRRIIHEIAETKGLIHESFGEKPNRYLRLQKIDLDIEKENLCDDPWEPTLPFESKRTYEKCGKKVLQNESVENVSLEISTNIAEQKGLYENCEDGPDHQLMLLKINSCVSMENLPTNYTEAVMLSENEEQEESKQKSLNSISPIENKNQEIGHCENSISESKNSVLTKTPKKKRKLKPSVNETLLSKINNGEEDNFDVTLDAFLKMEKICAHKSCKKDVIAYMPACEFCRKRFCSNHSQAEYHGCDAAAKANAKSQFRKEMSAPDHTSDPNDFKRLQNYRSLQKKLNELSSKRKCKLKSSKVP